MEVLWGIPESLPTILKYYSIKTEHIMYYLYYKIFMQLNTRF